MRKLIIILFLFISACSSGGSGNNYIIVPESTINLYDMALYKYSCPPKNSGNYSLATEISGSSCIAIIAEAYNPDYNVDSAFIEFIDPVGNVFFIDNIPITGDQFNPVQITVRLGSWDNNNYCGDWIVEFWIKDTNGKDSNSLFYLFEVVTGGSGCIPLP